MNLTPYKLAPAGETDLTFYSLLSQFTLDIQREGSRQLGFQLSAYYAWLSRYQAKTVSLQEAFTDILVFGVLWNEHAKDAMKSSILLRYMLVRLNSLRKQGVLAKKIANPLKGMLMHFFVHPPYPGFVQPTPSHQRVFRNWLRAGGEYDLQVQAVHRWVKFASSLEHAERNQAVKNVLDFACYFKQHAAMVFHPYTKGCKEFLKVQPEKFKYRESAYMTSRPEVEYHLNMVGGELLNVAMRERFERTNHRIVLLPACMRKEEQCKAEKNDIGLRCISCIASCQVSQLVKRFQDEADFYLIRHSSSYQKKVQQLSSSETAYIGVSCVPNLLEGGYALLEKELAAQCVYLNYPTCSKNWCGSGQGSRFSGNQLAKLLGAELDGLRIKRLHREPDVV